MLLRLLIVCALSLAATRAYAQGGAPSNGAGAGDEGAWTVEVLRGAEAWRQFGGNGRAGIEVRMGRPGIRVHDAATPPDDFIRIHGATRDPGPAAIPSHGVADAFDPSRIPVQRLHRTAGETRIRTHGLADAFAPGAIRVHGFGGRGI
jgi:hypothetical protein